MFKAKGDEPFYYTWSKQEKAQAFECDRLTPHGFVLKDGREILDLTSISCHASFGHRPAFIVAELERQLRDFPVHSPKADFHLKREVAMRLLEFVGLPKGIDRSKIFFCIGGASSIEHAIKMARQVTGRKVIVAQTRSYHGATLGASSLSGDWRGQKPLTVDQWTLRIPNALDDPTGAKAKEMILEYGPSLIAAVCLETVSAINGVITSSKKRYDTIQQICDEFQIKLILDEVACGFYRTGVPMAFHRYPGLHPDFVCMAKGMTGGIVPFGAVWTNSFVADYFKKEVLASGLTDYAHPLGLAACKGVLDHLKRSDCIEIIEKNQKIFSIEMERLKKLKKVSAVRWNGLMGVVEYKGRADWRDFLAAGVYGMVREGSLFLAPALNMETSLIVKGMEKVYMVLDNL